MFSGTGMEWKIITAAFGCHGGLVSASGINDARDRKESPQRTGLASSAHLTSARLPHSK